MHPTLLLIASLTALAGVSERPQFLEHGNDPSPGLLVNRTAGARPFDPPDPARPTVVFAHGLNPLPQFGHLTMGARLAEALGGRVGAAWNVLAWDWNSGRTVSPDPRDHWANAVDHGRRLAEALRAAGIDPARTHLIGHSSGSMVVASAARVLMAATGRMPAQLTLLEPAAVYHHVVFGWLAAGTAARRVENYWSPGLSGFGQPAPYFGVRNVCIEGPGRPLGAVWMPRSNHWYVAAWYFATAATPAQPGGFNESLLWGRP